MKRKQSYDSDWQQKHEGMLATPEKAMAQIKPGERVFIGTVQDVSERRRTENAIRDAVNRGDPRTGGTAGIRPAPAPVAAVV